MNNNPSICSKWMGRVLVSVSHEKTDKPELCTHKITSKKLLEEAEQYCRMQNFNVKLYIGHVIHLPKDNTRYDVVVQFAEKTWTFKPNEKSGTNYLRFNEFNTDNL